MSDADKHISREARAIMSLHDHGTRAGATAKSVQKGMEKEGFTRMEILVAVAALRSDATP